MELHISTDYYGDRFKYIKSEEGEPTETGTGHVFVYADVGGIAHIGIGLNLQVHLNLVLSYLGFDVNGDLLGGNDVASAREKQYIQDISNLINGPKGFLPGIGLTNDARTKLNQILASRASDSAYNDVTSFTRVTDFAFGSAVDSQAAFNQALAGYTDPVTGGHVEGYEQKLDRWLRLNGITTIPNAGSDLAQKGTEGLNFRQSNRSVIVLVNNTTKAMQRICDATTCKDVPTRSAVSYCSARQQPRSLFHRTRELPVLPAAVA